MFIQSRWQKKKKKTLFQNGGRHYLFPRTETNLYTDGSLHHKQYETMSAINEILKQGVIFSWCELHPKADKMGRLDLKSISEHTALLPNDEQDWKLPNLTMLHVKVGASG